MAIAIFGISNDGLNLVVNLLILMLVVVWLALIAYTYLDAKRRISDPFLVGCATLGAFIPYMGTAVYAIVRPPEFLDDARERELEIKAAELRVRQLTERSCPGCEFPIETDYLRCPKCQRRLKDPCPSCGRPVAPRWSLCPFCEQGLRGEAERSQRDESERPQRRRAREERRSTAKPEGRAAKPEGRKEEPARKQPPREGKDRESEKRPKGSSSREPHPDPRKA